MNSYARNGVVSSVENLLASVRAWFGKRAYTRAERFVLKQFAKTGARIRADEMRAAAAQMISEVKKKKIRPMSKQGQAELRRMVEIYVRDKTPMVRRGAASQSVGGTAPSEVSLVARIEKQHENLPVRARKELARRQLAIVERSAARSRHRTESVREDLEERRERAERQRTSVERPEPAGPPAKRKKRSKSQSDRRPKALCAAELQKTQEKRAQDRWEKAPREEKKRPAPKVFDRTKAIGAGAPGTSTAIATRGSQTATGLAKRAEDALADETGLVRVTVEPEDVSKAADTFGEAGALALLEEIEGAERCTYGGLSGWCTVFSDIDRIPAFFFVENPGGFVDLHHTHFLSIEDWEHANAKGTALVDFENVFEAVAFAKVVEEIFGDDVHDVLEEPSYEFLAWLSDQATFEDWALELKTQDLMEIYHPRTSSADGSALTAAESFRASWAERDNIDGQKALSQLSESQVGLTHAFLALALEFGPRLEELVWLPFGWACEFEGQAYYDMLSSEQAETIMRSPSLRGVVGFESLLISILEERGRLAPEEIDYEKYASRVEALRSEDLDELLERAERTLDAADLIRVMGSRVFMIDAIALAGSVPDEDEFSIVPYRLDGAFHRLVVEGELSFMEIRSAFCPGGNKQSDRIAFSGGRDSLPMPLRDGLLGDYADAVVQLFSIVTRDMSAMSLEDIVSDLFADWDFYSGEEYGMLSTIERLIDIICGLAEKFTGISYVRPGPPPDNDDVYQEAREMLDSDGTYAEMFDVVREADPKLDDEEVHELVIDGAAYSEALEVNMRDGLSSSVEAYKDSVSYLFRYKLPFTSYEFFSRHIVVVDEYAGDEYAVDDEEVEENLALGALFGQAWALLSGECEGPTDRTGPVVMMRPAVQTIVQETKLNLDVQGLEYTDTPEFLASVWNLLAELNEGNQWT